MKALLALCLFVWIYASFAKGLEELTSSQSLNMAMSVDSDNDGIVNAKDNCPGTYNPDQKDSLKNGIGDACRPKRIIPKKRPSQ
jgi:hypothetical protein